MRRNQHIKRTLKGKDSKMSRIPIFLFGLAFIPAVFSTASSGSNTLPKWVTDLINLTRNPAVCEHPFKGQNKDTVSGPVPNYELLFFTRLRSHLDYGSPLSVSIEAGERFRRAFYKGEFKGDERYISVPLYQGPFAKVVQVNETGITVDLITHIDIFIYNQKEGKPFSVLMS